LDNEVKWKKLIAYFDMEGTHLLANSRLTDDIMAKINGRANQLYSSSKKTAASNYQKPTIQ